MKTKALFFLSFAVLFISTSFAQPGTWDRLGSRAVNYTLDRDVIPVGARDGGFRKLKVVVTGGALNMHKLVVHYMNGEKDEITLRHNFTRRSNSRVIDLSGGKRLIKKIVMVYDTKNLARRRAKVHIYGRH